MTEIRNRYFPHVDGLRAIAVCGVLFYHVDLSGFGGGFVGVDVFFVISGYLITSHLLSELRRGRLRLQDFYLRRVRRLGPALMFTLAATFLAATLLLPPDGFQLFSESAVAAAFSLSNILFWSQSGYFDADGLSKPLLHTWSLGVEEQFYLVWPLLIFMAYRCRRVIVLIAVIGLCSFAAAQLFLASAPSAVFYLTPFRMGEFAIGGLVALLPQLQTSTARELLTVLGLGLVGLSIASFGGDVAFPGLSALVPCLGAAALIVGGEARWSGRLLRNTAVVTIGKISYSLYLAHWPIIVFYREWYPGPLSYTEQGLLVTASVIAGYLMYRYVETPFRRPRTHPLYLSQKQLLQVVGGTAIVVVASATHAYTNDGWRWRPNAALALEPEEIAAERERRFVEYRRICGERGWDRCNEPLADGTSVLILGDSHAPDGLNALVHAFPDMHYVLRTHTGCPPLVDSDTSLLLPGHPDRAECVEQNAEILTTEYLKHFDAVVINVLFDWYQPEHLARAIDRIHAAGIKKVMVFGNYIVFEDELTDIVARRSQRRHALHFVKSFARYETQLQELARKKGFSFVSKASIFCETRAIESCAIYNGDGSLITYDRHHLSYQAAVSVGRALQRDFVSFDNLFDTFTANSSLAHEPDPVHAGRVP